MTVGKVLLLALFMLSFWIMDIGEIAMSNNNFLTNGVWCIGSGANYGLINGLCYVAVSNPILVYHAGMYGALFTGIIAFCLLFKKEVKT